MKEISKKVFSVLLVIAILMSPYATFNVLADASATEEQTDIVISTNKSSYGILDAATVNVTVTNNSIYDYNDVVIAIESSDLLYLKANGSKLFSLDLLESGETVEWSFKVGLSSSHSKINFFQRLLLSLKNFFVPATTVTKEYDSEEKSVMVTSKSIKFKNIEASLNAYMYYVGEQKVITTNDMQTFSTELTELINKQMNSNSFNSSIAAQNDYYSGRIIIKGNDIDFNKYETDTIIAGPDDTYIVQFDSASKAIEFQSEQEMQENVEFAEPDIFINLDPVSISSQDYNNANYNSWGVEYIEANTFAKYLVDKKYTSTMVVAVVDTGVDTNHTYLKNKLVAGYDYIDSDDNPHEGTDGTGHGTHVSGTILDCTPGLNIKIMPIRVLDINGNGYSSAVASGIKYAASHGAKVINLSLGGGHSQYKDDAVNYAISKGVTVCVAAGNENTNTSNKCPAHITTSGCVTVAAIDSNGKKASFSNYGNAVDIAAPGVAIKSSIPGNKYEYFNGTSMATPHISAVAAMLKLQNAAATPEQIENQIKAYTLDLGSSGYDVYYGYGVNKLSKAVPKATYTIKYDANGGTGAPASQTKTQGVNLTLSSTKPILSGYTFLGWAESSSATSAAYSAGGQYTKNASATLYAVWKKDTVATYTITYNANGGVGAPPKQTKTHGVSLTLSSTAPTRDGYRFLGWSHYDGATSPTYYPGDTYTANSSTTLYAVWKKIEITLSSYSGSGTQAASSANIYTLSMWVSGDKPADFALGTYKGFRVKLPEVTSNNAPGYGTSGWTVYSGDCVINGDYMYISQPGTVKVRYCTEGYYSDYYSDVYTYTLSLTKTTTATNYIRSSASSSATNLGSIPANKTVSISSINWNGTYTKDGTTYPAAWGKVTYGGKTGYIILWYTHSA